MKTDIARKAHGIPAGKTCLLIFNSMMEPPENTSLNSLEELNQLMKKNKYFFKRIDETGDA
ncbi:MAG: hypothetical protein MI975_05450 [Cytophagales bacterium]|nr:hypothetical protein [Cytophagales bacterium]